MRGRRSEGESRRGGKSRTSHGRPEARAGIPGRPEWNLERAPERRREPAEAYFLAALASFFGLRATFGRASLREAMRSLRAARRALVLVSFLRPERSRTGLL